MDLLLLDDHQLFGQSLKGLLEDQNEISRCDYVDNARTLFDQLRAHRYDLVLIDINLKADFTGFDVIEKIKETYKALPIVILTAYDLVNYQRKAYDLGVKDFINKSIEIKDLLPRLKAATQKNARLKRIDLLDPLTPREVEILQELVQGKTKKDVALALFISERTLYNHLSNLYDKLGVTNLIEAYNKTMDLGYLKPKF